MKKRIKLFDPVTDVQEKLAVKKVLQSHFWASGEGKNYVAKFENKFKNYVGAKQCIAVNSGTAALHLALSVVNIRNKEVILPSMTFVSTAHAIVYNGGKPIFVDIDKKTLCINPKEIKRAISSKTKAILPVHFGGLPCNLTEISKICKKYNISLVEDAAHAAGATYNKKRIGSHGNFVCFSFHPVKNLAMPTGGAITLNNTNTKKIKTILNSRRWCGISNRKNAQYDIRELGWNYYMNEFSAAIGLEQLKKLDRMNKKRKKIAKQYYNEIELPEKMLYSYCGSYHFYWILVKNRRELMNKLFKNNIETGIHYKPIHKMKFYENKWTLPITDFVSQKIVSLPMHPNLSDFDISKIIKLVNKFSRF